MHWAARAPCLGVPVNSALGRTECPQRKVIASRLHRAHLVAFSAWGPSLQLCPCETDVIYLFWILAVSTGALASALILLTLAGQRLSAGTPWWLSVSTGLAVLWLINKARVLATTSGRPGVAALLVVASWILFLVVMLTNGLLRQRNWQ